MKAQQKKVFREKEGIKKMIKKMETQIKEQNTLQREEEGRRIIIEEEYKQNIHQLGANIQVLFCIK